jgi:hypothetical protein
MLCQPLVKDLPRVLSTWRPKVSSQRKLQNSSTRPLPTGWWPSLSCSRPSPGTRPPRDHLVRELCDHRGSCPPCSSPIDCRRPYSGAAHASGGTIRAAHLDTRIIRSIVYTDLAMPHPDLAADPPAGRPSATVRL